MTRQQQDAEAFMEQSKRRAEKHLQELKATLDQLREADDETSAAIMISESARALRYHEEEIACQQARARALQQDNLPSLNVDTSSQGGGRGTGERPEALAVNLSPKSRSSMDARLRAMGAIPALGGLMIANTSMNGRSALHPTDSPAARELSQRPSDAQQPSTVADAASAQEPASPPWQGEVHLRRTNGPAVTTHTNPVNSELNAMFARRQSQRQQAE